MKHLTILPSSFITTQWQKEPLINPQSRHTSVNLTNHLMLSQEKAPVKHKATRQAIPIYKSNGSKTHIWCTLSRNVTQASQQPTAYQAGPYRWTSHRWGFARACWWWPCFKPRRHCNCHLTDDKTDCKKGKTDVQMPHLKLGINASPLWKFPSDKVNLLFL